MRDVSADGRVVVGTGQPPGIGFEAWVAVIASPGDCDWSGSVDLIDFAAFAGCVTGPDAKEPLPNECRCHDLDLDDDVDLHDFAAFQDAFGQ